MRHLFSSLIICILTFTLSGPVSANELPKTITLLHTNDLHSHLMPFAPEIDYIPDETATDETVGGFARIATILKTEREKRTNPTFTVDAGDYTMGTLFHMLAREESFELRLLYQMGYDLVTLGNHEFDMFSHGLARMITTAHDRDQLPGIVFSNAVFSTDSSKDDTLEAVFEKGLVKPYAVRDVEGVRIGFFGIMGTLAAGDAPFAAPVTFRDPIEASRDMVKILREQENVDIVVCLSHSGIFMASVSEDEELAVGVPGIDIIISGHSHTLLPEPLIVNNTIIVQAGNYGRGVGALDIIFDGEKTTLDDYSLIAVNDTIPADPSVQAQIDAFIVQINEEVLGAHGLSYWKIIGQTDFDMPVREEESTGGNFLADAIRWYVNKDNQAVIDPDGLEEGPEPPVQMAIKANGVIRADILKGNSGQLSVADIFRTLPLGIGMDEKNTPGYPIVTCYIHAYEIKRALEIITTVYPLKGDVYFLQLSGIRFTYNPYRAPFDRVTGIWIESGDGNYKPLDYSRANPSLFRVAANIYEATFLQVIGDFTWNFLKIIPKDRYGRAIDSLVDYRVDAHPDKPGVQELKEWLAVMTYIAQFEDKTGNGLPDIPDQYRQAEGRIIVKASLNPVNLLYRGTMITWAAFVFIVILFVLVNYTARLIYKKYM